MTWASGSSTVVLGLYVYREVFHGVATDTGDKSEGHGVS